MKDLKARKHLAVSLDLIIPVYNESEILPDLFHTLSTVFSPEALANHNIKHIRLLFIDDGSSDTSAEIISDYIQKGVPASLIRFTRNFGHQNAVTAGLDNATADVVAVIDADLQDPPEILFNMLAKWREGYYVIYGQRRKRKENIIKVTSYFLFYRLLRLITEVDMPLDSGDFALMDRQVIQAMQKLPEKIKYPRVIRAWVGFPQTGLPYERAKRNAGMSKYSFSKLYKLATDGIAAASIRPLKITQFFSIVYVILVSSLLLYTIIRYPHYIKTNNEIALWFLFGYGLILTGGLIQAFSNYVLSAYIGRGYQETKGRPPYIILEIIDTQKQT